MSKMRCVDVAALFAAAILRRSPDSVVIPYDTRAYQVRVDPADSILSVAERLAQFGGGGTDCSVPIREANTRYRSRRFAGVVLVGDTKGRIYRNRAFAYGHHGATFVLTEWQKFVKNQMRLGGHDIQAPKLVSIDLQPYTTTQAPDRDDILNIGGFSGSVRQLSLGAQNRPVMGALKPAMHEEVGVRHLGLSIPLWKEMLDGEPTHDGQDQRDPYPPQIRAQQPEDCGGIGRPPGDSGQVCPAGGI